MNIFDSATVTFMKCQAHFAELVTVTSSDRVLFYCDDTSTSTMLIVVYYM